MGKPLATTGADILPLTVVERFARKVNTLGECWLWKAGVDSWGYPVFWAANGFEHIRGHRFMFELINARRINPSLVIDHICFNKRCVNPSHLQEVTQRVNLFRSPTIQATNAAKTHCVRGHEFDEVNTRIDAKGRRDCLACKKLHNKRAWQKTLALRATLTPQETSNE